MWATAGILLLAWVGVAAGVNAAGSGDVKDARAQAAKEIRFYQVVAGELSGSELGPANRLARDLKEASADKLVAFQGDSNRYGGITIELGFDPFDGVDCSECGPLDGEVISNVEAVKIGNLSEVIQSIQAEIPTQGEESGPPAAIWLLWIISFPTYAGFMYIKHHRSIEAKYRDFSDERQLIGQLREAQHGLPPGNQEWLALDQLADNLQEQIDARVSYTKSKAQKVRISTLTQEATSVLEDIEAGNKALD